MANLKLRLSIAGLSLLSAAASADTSFLGLYCVPTTLTAVDGRNIGHEAQNELELKVSLTHEEGPEALYLAGELGELITVELVREEERLRRDALALAWSTEIRNLPLDEELPIDPPDPAILDPRTARVTHLLIRPQAGGEFPTGAYTVALEIDRDAVRTPQGDPWQGRGGRCLVRFDLVAVETLDDRQRQLTSAGQIHLRRGELAQAYEKFSRLVELDPDHPRGNWRVAQTLARLGDHEAAVKHYEKVLPTAGAKGTTRQAITLELAASYLHLDLATKAKALLDENLPAEQATEVFTDLSLKVRALAPSPD